jgi:hypothetical protein
MSISKGRFRANNETNWGPEGSPALHSAGSTWVSADSGGVTNLANAKVMAVTR